MVEGVSFSLSLYPNGVKGYSHHTAVLLISDVHSTPVYVDFKIQIGEKVLDEKGMIKPGYGIGAPQWLPHKTLSLHKSEVITVKLTIQEVWTNKAFKKFSSLSLYITLINRKKWFSSHYQRVSQAQYLF